VYFYDLGVRNSIINNFNGLDNRSDVGGLFENWCILERTKALHNANTHKPHQYFWRNYAQKEVDYLEEQNGKLNAFECKFTNAKITKYTSILKDLPVKNITLVTQGTLGAFLNFA
jgi:hypothetical protein